MTAEMPEGKKGPKVTEIAAVVSVMVSVLIAGTTLFNYSGNLPWWWIQFSFVFLIILTFSVPVMVYAHPISMRIGNVRKNRRRDSVSRYYASEFKDLVNRSQRFTSSIRSLLDNIRRQHAKEIKDELAMHALESYNEPEVQNALYKIEVDVDRADMNFRDLCLLMDKFEMVLNTSKKSLRILEVFAHEIMMTSEKPISKSIEAEYEAFREKYNDFLKDLTAFCHKMNLETEAYDFPEHSFDYLKKW